MTYQEKDNQGAAFFVNSKSEDWHRDMEGKIFVTGGDKWLDVYINRPKGSTATDEQHEKILAFMRKHKYYVKVGLRDRSAKPAGEKKYGNGPAQPVQTETFDEIPF